MAAGDILSVAIAADGWYADVTVEGLGTGGTYNLGLGPNQSPVNGTPKVAFTVTSLSYDDTGAATTLVRKIYGTTKVRKMYPNEATNEEAASGGNVTFRIALSDYIYAKDKAGGGNSGTDISVVILAGLYTQGGTPSNAATLTVTNNSTCAYQPGVANWSWPGFQRITGPFTLRTVAFHRDGRESRPVRCVKFSATDGTNTVTQTVLMPTVDRSMPDEVAVVEYVATLDPAAATPAALTQGAVITCNFIAYPWVGDSASVVDSSAGATAPSPLVGPRKFLCDRTGAYGVTYALVDPSTGSDAGALTVYDSSTYNPATAYKFATIAKAARAIHDYNNTNRSRDNVGAGVIELAAGNYAWLGATTAGGYGATPDTFLTIKAAAGLTRSQVVINSASGNGDVSDRIKLEGVRITATPNNLFDAIAALWIHDCEIDTTGTGIITGTSMVSITHSKIKLMDQGLRFVAGTNTAFGLIRGNDLNNFNKTILYYTMLGNRKDATYTSTLVCQDWLGGQPTPIGPTIFGFNKLMNMNPTTDNAVLWCGMNTAGTSAGGVVVQNVIEMQHATSSLAEWASASVLEGVSVHNWMIWNNTTVGHRIQSCYNSVDAHVTPRDFWSYKNNYFDICGLKADLFTATGGANGARTGNRAQVHGVGYSGCVSAACITSPFPKFFPGLASIENLSNTVHTFPQFVDRQSYNGSTAGPGNGNYQVLPTSPLIYLPCESVLPFDITGNARGGYDVAGAYAAGIPAKSGFFF